MKVGKQGMSLNQEGLSNGLNALLQNDFSDRNIELYSHLNEPWAQDEDYLFAISETSWVD